MFTQFLNHVRYITPVKPLSCVYCTNGYVFFLGVFFACKIHICVGSYFYTNTVNIVIIHTYIVKCCFEEKINSRCRCSGIEIPDKTRTIRVELWFYFIFVLISKISNYYFFFNLQNSMTNIVWNLVY